VLYWSQLVVEACGDRLIGRRTRRTRMTFCDQRGQDKICAELYPPKVLELSIFWGTSLFDRCALRDQERYLLGADPSAQLPLPTARPRQGIFTLPLASHYRGMMWINLPRSAKGTLVSPALEQELDALIEAGYLPESDHFPDHYRLMLTSGQRCTLQLGDFSFLIYPALAPSPPPPQSPLSPDQELLQTLCLLCSLLLLICGLFWLMPPQHEHTRPVTIYTSPSLVRLAPPRPSPVSGGEHRGLDFSHERVQRGGFKKRIKTERSRYTLRGTSSHRRSKEGESLIKSRGSTPEVSRARAKALVADLFQDISLSLSRADQLSSARQLDFKAPVEIGGSEVSRPRWTSQIKPSLLSRDEQIIPCINIRGRPACAGFTKTLLPTGELKARLTRTPSTHSAHIALRLDFAWRQSIQRQILARAEALRSCLRRAPRGAELRRTLLIVQLKLSGLGEITAAEFSGDLVEGERVKDCLLEAIKGHPLDPPPNRKVRELRLPLQLNSETKGAA
ncbi:MAG: hypothetical protein VYD19_01645, partial [Myxococcota bacterium]|nr:hypothetical protein [Myxococcota bacterium]